MIVSDCSRCEARRIRVANGPQKAKPRKPFVFKWQYPIVEPRVILHKARTIQVRGRDKSGRVILAEREVPAYNQVVR